MLAEPEQANHPTVRKRRRSRRIRGKIRRKGRRAYEGKMKNWEKYIHSVKPYVPGEQPEETDVIKLNTNECPYPPSEAVSRAAAEFKTDNLRLYPAFPEKSPLAEAVAEYYGLEKDQIFFGVGSDDVLANIFMTFFHSDRPILFPDITYSFYPVWAELFRIPYERPKLDSEFRICPGDYLRENGGIVFPNPNAPTSVFMPLAEVEDIVRGNPDVVVVVDEAYIDFGGESALPLTKKYDNLLIVQTFSKSRALAGARIGFAMGNRRLIQALQNVKYSFNSYTLNSYSLAAGTAALKDVSYFKEITGKITAVREKSKQRLAQMGFTFPDSRTNFIFASHRDVPAEEIYQYLKSKKIYVRYFPEPRIDHYLRITVGTEEQMERLFQELEVFLRP